MKVQVIFICLGNICRSPMAEAIFQKMVDDAGLSHLFSIDSAGTSSWHIGEHAHHGTKRVLADHDIDYSGRARQIGLDDVARENTYLIAMDQSNLYDIRSKFGNHARLYRLLDFSGQGEVRDVPDPYYNGNFEYVFQLVSAGCQGLLAAILDWEELEEI